MSWRPFAGTFIARFSRGRTIQEFIVGVIIARRASACCPAGAA
ncbi:BCCT family transporter [Streptomyces massasporeus]